MDKLTVRDKNTEMVTKTRKEMFHKNAFMSTLITKKTKRNPKKLLRIFVCLFSPLPLIKAFCQNIWLLLLFFATVSLFSFCFAN